MLGRAHSGGWSSHELGSPVGSAINWGKGTGKRELGFSFPFFRDSVRGRAIIGIESANQLSSHTQSWWDFGGSFLMNMCPLVGFINVVYLKKWSNLSEKKMITFVRQ